MASSSNIKMTREEQLRSAALINADRHQKLFELGRIIRGARGPGLGSKSASIFDRPKKVGYLERQFELKEMGKLVRS